MRIAYLAMVEIDIPNACLVHTREIAEQMAALGHEVTLFLPRPLRMQKWQRVGHVWVWLWAFSGIKAFLFQIEMALRFLLLQARKRFDVAYLREMDNNGIIPHLCRWLKVPLFIEVNGWLLKELQLAGVTPRKLQRTARKQFSDFHNATGLIASTAGVARKIAERYGIEKDRILLQELGSNPDFFKPGDKDTARKSLKLPASDHIFLYVGSFASSHDLPLLLKAFTAFLEIKPQSLLVLVGEGAPTQSIREITTQLDICEKVVFAGSVPYDKVGTWMQAADIGVIPLQESNIRQRDGCMTLKLWDYLSSGLPVIATDLPGTSTDSRFRNHIISVPPGNATLMTKAMLKLIDDFAGKNELAVAGRALVVEQCTWKGAAKQSLSFIRRQLQPGFKVIRNS